MAKKIVKKKKLKVTNLLLLIIIILFISLLTILFLQIKTQNIIIKNTEYLNDDYILRLADLYDYPKYYGKETFKIKSNLKKSPFITDVKVNRKFFHTLEIKVVEKKPVYFRDSDKKTVFSDNSSYLVDSSEYVFNVPRLLNDIPKNIQKDFIKKVLLIDEDILNKVSDILYDPNDIDKERFLLYMDDGNMVYLTLTKFEVINYYDQVLEQLENRKGILYLDNGNHFQIKE